MVLEAIIKELVAAIGSLKSIANEFKTDCILSPASRLKSKEEEQITAIEPHDL